MSNHDTSVLIYNSETNEAKRFLVIGDASLGFETAIEQSLTSNDLHQLSEVQQAQIYLPFLYSGL